jgi:hypothetical protein
MRDSCGTEAAKLTLPGVLPPEPGMSEGSFSRSCQQPGLLFVKIDRGVFV